MKYHYPGPVHPFPRMEGWLLFLGVMLVILGKEYGFHVLVLAGAVFLWAGAIFAAARWFWDKKPISDHAFSVLQNESRFPSVRKAWEKICGTQRRPTWGEMDRIWANIRYRIRS